MSLNPRHLGYSGKYPLLAEWFLSSDASYRDGSNDYKSQRLLCIMEVRLHPNRPIISEPQRHPHTMDSSLPHRDLCTLLGGSSPENEIFGQQTRTVLVPGPKSSFGSHLICLQCLSWVTSIPTISDLHRTWDRGMSLSFFSAMQTGCMLVLRLLRQQSLP